MTTIATEYEVQVIEAVTEDSNTVEIVYSETEFIEVIEKGSKGNKGDQGDSYEFTGGNLNEVWTVIGENTYGWKDVIPEVTVDGESNTDILTGKGLESTQKDGKVEIGLSGKTDIIEFDVNENNSPRINSSFAGSEVTITQSGAQVIIRVYFEAHDTFETGQTFTIRTGESYESHLFVVYYSKPNGTYGILYPSFSCTLTRTDEGWDTEEDGRLTRIAIVSDSEVVQYSDTSNDTRGVSGIVFDEHPAVEFKETDEGIQILSVNLNKQAERNTVSFVNKASIEVNYEQAFISKVYLLKKVDVQGHSIVVTINGESEAYVTVGLFSIDQQNLWSEDSYRMCFKGEVSGKGIVYDKYLESWVLVNSGYPDVGEFINSDKTILMNHGMLPESFGNVEIDSRFETIPKTFFAECLPQEEYNTETKTVLISFAGTYQTGYVVL